MKARAPALNTFDLVEHMPGAQSSATPAQRVEFEQRCQKLYREEVHEHGCAASRASARTHIAVSDMEAMFPSLDSALVHALCAEAASPQHALNTLLALSALSADPEPTARTIPRQDIGVDDADEFPLLVDSDGWQVPGVRAKAGVEEGALGSAWRDRAKVAAALPCPQRTSADRTVAKRRPAIPNRTIDAHQGAFDGAEDSSQWETDLDFRQRRGELRARNMTRASRAQCDQAGVPPIQSCSIAEHYQSTEEDE